MSRSFAQALQIFHSAVVGLSEFHSISLSGNKTDIVLGCVALVLLEIIGINIGGNSIVNAPRSLIIPSKYIIYHLISMHFLLF